MPGCSALIIDLLCSDHETTCASFHAKFWLDYYITKVVIKTVLKSFLLCLLNTFRDLDLYAQNYAGIIGLARLNIVARYS